MDPKTTLERLRQDHGVSEDFAKRFLPLVTRATQTSREVRERILQLVERSFRRHAERQAERLEQRRKRPMAAIDEILLDKVARVLHRWEPAPWLTQWQDGHPGT